MLDLVGLGGVGRKPVRAYSLGMRQRLGLAAALVRRPRLLVLDEPTNGLDPQGIQEIRDLLLRLNEEGTTIFLSSHLLAEVEQLCTRVGVMDRGRLVTQVAMDEVRRPTGRVLVRVGDPDAAVALLDGHVAGRDGDRLIVAGAAVPGARPAAGRDGHRGARGGRRATHPREPRARAHRPGLGPGGRRPPVIAVELRKLVRRPRTWVSVFLLCLLPAIVAVFLAVSRDRPRGPARGRRSSPPSSPRASCSPRRRSRSSCRCSCRSRWP